MSFYILKCEGSPKGDEALSIDGQYLKTFDPEHNNGQGMATFTLDPGEAKRFAERGDAFEYLSTQPKCRPTRPDGLPNKPLWATNWSIAEVGNE